MFRSKHKYTRAEIMKKIIKSDRVNLVAPASPVHRARYSTNLEPEGLARLGNSNVLGCP